jgi:hypothetical protein
MRGRSSQGRGVARSRVLKKKHRTAPYRDSSFQPRDLVASTEVYSLCYHLKDLFPGSLVVGTGVLMSESRTVLYCSLCCT